MLFNLSAKEITVPASEVFHISLGVGFSNGSAHRLSEQSGPGITEKPRCNGWGWERREVVTHEQPTAPPLGEGQSRRNPAGRNSIHYDLHDLAVLRCPGGTPASVGFGKSGNRMKEARQSYPDWNPLPICIYPGRQSLYPLKTVAAPEYS
jgi:hypothetical protein